ncbi:glycosyltransferase family 4 protein [Vagococcus salmoninarum]|uniref:glycosyltransferase family 4 protein n=1 Tax=Vagococcus salmoninarum TaxID=2739 RepID=UPI0018820A5A|nr:glycosyltransferase family 4 protein [Vagococcus salmoninarum]MBE9387810.1 glycosyltransferase family 4 protein [Vagococcus salmoninarum]
MKKIAILANDAASVINFRKELIESFLEQGHEVHLCLPYGDELDSLIEKGCKFHSITLKRRGKNLLSDIKLYAELKHLIGEIKPSIVLTYTIKLNLYGSLAASKFKVPVIMNITGLGSSFQQNNLLRKLLVKMYKLASRKVAYILFQNEENLNFFQNENIVAQKKMKLISGSGVNISTHQYQEYKKEQLQEKKFIFVGRIMEEKGVLEFLEVAKRFQREEKTGISFHLYGKKEDNSINEVNKMVKEGAVRYHGPVSNINEVMKESYALVLPSYHEGMSNVLLENAALGRIGMASDIAGCHEIVEHRKTGFLFEMKNTEQMYNIILEVSRFNLETANKVGKAARLKVERDFDRENICSLYNDLINELI